jgi:RNA polymerase sigma-70 factor (ECF subfamily)
MEPSEMPPPNLASAEATEAELLTALRGGDQAAFETLVRANCVRLLAVARRLLRHEEDARDVVQEAFLSAFKAIGSFDGNARLSTWLHRIVVNAALQRLRSRQRQPVRPIEELLPQFLADGHHARDAVEWREPVEAALQRQETCDLVRAAIEQLPEPYRSVLLLRDIEGLDTDETARLLGIQPGAVKTRLHRARQALRTLLDPHLRGGDS